MSQLIANTFPARPTQGGRFNPDILIGDWRYQPKYNGWRAFIDLPEDQVFNRHGEPMSIGDCFRRAIDSIREDCLAVGIRYLDAEALERRFDSCRGALILLDIPDCTEPLETRMEMLSYLAPVHDVNKAPEPNTVLTTPTFGEAEARTMWTWLQQLNNAYGFEIYEGLVAKKAGSEYPVSWSANDTFKDWVKFRFDQFRSRRQLYQGGKLVAQGDKIAAQRWRDQGESDIRPLRSGMGEAVDNYAAMHGIDHMR